jgi:iron complex outermembrane recepter protein
MRVWLAIAGTIAIVAYPSAAQENTLPDPSSETSLMEGSATPEVTAVPQFAEPTPSPLPAALSTTHAQPSATMSSAVPPVVGPAVPEAVVRSQPKAQQPAIAPHQPATTVKDWLAQIEAETTQVTGVTLNPTETGLEIVLETGADKPLPIDATRFRTVGNSLVAEIGNAVLALPNAQEFIAENPTAEITTVGVSQLDVNTIQVRVTGNNAPPTSEVRLKTGELVYSVNPDEDEEEVEIEVTAEQEDGYRVPNASTATKTDTPLRDIPQTIQVVPRQVLEDQNVSRLEEAVRNTPGVNQASASYFINGTFLVIRGFTARDDSGNILRNGVSDPISTRQIDFANIEQVEVLKGPSSVLFGRANPGGTVNIITKQPLKDSAYAINATIGSYDFYRGAVDLTGSLNDSKTISYRLNAAYQDIGSFIDFVDSNRLFIAPVISFDIGDRTKLTFEGEFSSSNNKAALGVPAAGSILPNPNGRLPLSRNIGEPFAGPFDVQTYRIGYKLEHQFNDNLALRSEFRFSSYYATLDQIVGLSLNADNRTLNRQYTERTFFQQGYNFTTDLIGKFSTGPIKHQVVFGVDLNRFDTPTFLGIGRSIQPIDIFNPVYGSPLGSSTFTRFNIAFKTDALGIYVQDQITLLDNLKLLVGGRFDTFKRTDKDFVSNTETSISKSAFSPRVGIVYQPIQPVSLYASYSRSFTPVTGLAFDGSSFEPERGTQYEIGVKADISNKLSATLAFFDLTRSNALTDDPVNLGFSIQTGEQRSRGLELSIGGEILPGWNIFAGYAYANATITNDTNPSLVGNLLNNSPENSFNLWTTYEIQSGSLKGLGLGAGLFYKGATQGDLANTFTVPSYLRTDAALFYKRGNFRGAINIRNLFDLNYYEFALSRTTVYAAEPLTVQATVSWEF